MPIKMVLNQNQRDLAGVRRLRFVEEQFHAELGWIGDIFRDVRAELCRCVSTSRGASCLCVDGRHVAQAAVKAAPLEEQVVL